MKKKELNIIALANSESQPNSFVVILKEEAGTRRLPVVIGGFEAQAIAIAIENIQPNRPLTHDLFKNALIAIGVDLKEIVISDLKNNIFYATLFFEHPDGSIVELDSRTSDALALAIRFGCPIFANESILDKAGIELENEDTPTETTTRDQPIEEQSLTSLTEEELKELLEKALSGENYERAADIRDEIKRRKAKD